MNTLPEQHVAGAERAVGAPAIVASTAIITAATAQALVPTLSVTPAGWLVITVAVGGAVIWAVRMGVRQRRVDAVLAVTVAVMIVTVAARAATLETGPLAHLAVHGETVEVNYTIVVEPRPLRDGWYAIARVTAIDGQSTNQRAAITGADTSPPLGSRWQAMARVRAVPEGGFGERLRQLHAVALLSVNEATQTAEGSRLAVSSEHVRDRVRQTAAQFADQRHAGLLIGLVLGDTRHLADADREAMRDVGMSHLTAVSGLHVALVAAGIYSIATLLRLPLPARRAVTIVTLMWFAYLTRLSPSVLRATAMALVVIAATNRGYGRDSRHALAIAVLVLMMVDPYLAGSVGLQLSAAATLGILVIAPVLRRRLRWLPVWLAKPASIALGAQIAVAPVLIITFGSFSAASVPANIVAVPAAMLAAAISFVAAALSLVAPTAAAALFWCASWPAALVLAIAQRFADVQADISMQHPWTIVACCAVVVGLLARRRRLRRMAYAVTAVAVGATVVPLVVGSLPPRDFTVTAIDVGQASAILVESPHTRLLIDAGEDETAARWLRRNGRRSLDLLIITHPHLDHIGGGAEVMRRLNVSRAWLRPVEPDSAMVETFVTAATRHDVAVAVPARGNTAVVGDLTLEVLHPPHGRPYAHTSAEVNDMSLVVRVSAPDGRRVLVTGDIEQAAQADLVQRDSGGLSAEVLIVPHHGAATTSPEFLAATGATTAIISAGADNTHGHPHADIVAQLAALGMNIVRTDIDGTQTVSVPHPRAASTQLQSAACPQLCSSPVTTTCCSNVPSNGKSARPSTLTATSRLTVMTSPS